MKPSRRLSTQRLYWHHGKEQFDSFFKRDGARPPPFPEPYPEHCLRWWKAL